MNNLKLKLLKLKRRLLNLTKEKSVVEKYMLRRHEPPRVKNAALVAAKRYVKK